MKTRADLRSKLEAHFKCQPKHEKWLMLALISLFVLVCVRFGLSYRLLPALVFTLLCFLLAVCDAYTFLLPDRFTQALLWTGLFFNLYETFSPLGAAVSGVFIGYGILLCLDKIYYLWRKKEGVGAGDLKLSAAIGAWLGYPAIVQILCVAAFAGILGALFFFYWQKKSDGKRKNQNFIKMHIPLGPYLATAAFCRLLYF